MIATIIDVDLLGAFGLVLWAIVTHLLVLTVGYKLIRPAATSLFDPLIYSFIFFLAPALTGFIVSPFILGRFSPSYFIILFYIASFFVVMRFIGRPRSPLIQTGNHLFEVVLVVSVIAIILLNFIVNMLMTGNIPLFAESGTWDRFSSTQNNRVLAWLNFASYGLPGPVFFMTKSAVAKRLALVAIALALGFSLLFASKGAVVSVLFLMVNGVAIYTLLEDHERSLRLRKKLIYVAAIVALLIPVWFVVVGFGDIDNIAALLALRLFGGFDQLIPAIFADMANTIEGIPGFVHSIIVYQGMPFFKFLFAIKPEYDSVGQYVIYQMAGNVIEGGYTFPNSNLILEVIFTNGYLLGWFIFLVGISCFYLARYYALRGRITPLKFWLLNVTFFAPFNYFLSGQEWVTNSILAGGVVFGAWVLSELLRFMAFGVKNASLVLTASEVGR